MCADTFIPASIMALMTGDDSFLVLTCATCIYTLRSGRFLQIAAMGERDRERPLRSMMQYQLKAHNREREGERERERERVCVCVNTLFQ